MPTYFNKLDNKVTALKFIKFSKFDIPGINFQIES